MPRSKHFGIFGGIGPKHFGIFGGIGPKHFGIFGGNGKFGLYVKE